MKIANEIFFHSYRSHFHQTIDTFLISAAKPIRFCPHDFELFAIHGCYMIVSSIIPSHPNSTRILCIRNNVNKQTNRKSNLHEGNKSIHYKSIELNGTFCMKNMFLNALVLLLLLLLVRTPFSALFILHPIPMDCFLIFLGNKNEKKIMKFVFNFSSLRLLCHQSYAIVCSQFSLFIVKRKKKDPNICVTGKGLLDTFNSEALQCVRMTTIQIENIQTPIHLSFVNFNAAK